MSSPARRMIPLFLLLLAGRISAELQLKLHPDVDSALKAGRAVVALESTIISHGMPYPQNVQTAREVEGDRESRGRCACDGRYSRWSVLHRLDRRRARSFRQTRQ